jgi:uncharacterized membrane protein YecN with MAPEG domain
MNITILYASLLAILFVVLSVRTIRLRRVLKIGVGDAGNSKLLRAMRVHSNFSEYTPFALLMIGFVEGNMGSATLVHALGFCLLVGRLFHAYGVSQERENFKFRVTGMALTFTTILTCSIYLLHSYIVRAI